MEKEKYDPAILRQKANFELFRNSLLQKLIQEAVLIGEAKRLGIKPTAEEIKQLEEKRTGLMTTRDGVSALKEQGISPNLWRTSQVKRLTISKLIEQEVLEKIPVTEEEVNEYYKNHASTFHRPAQFHARQILVDSKEAAERLERKEIKKFDPPSNQA